FVDDAADGLAAAENQASREAMDDNVLALDGVVEEGFGAVVALDEDGRNLRARPETQPRMHPIIRGPDGLQGRRAAAPEVEVLVARDRIGRETLLHLLAR